jgi:hypothetical protein
MSDSFYMTNNKTDSIEVVQTPGERGRKKNKLIKEGWTSPSVFTIETIGTMDSTKVADNLADFAENDEDYKKTWMRVAVEKFWMKVSLLIFVRGLMKSFIKREREKDNGS